jgi:hypothetical protein
MTSRAAAEGGHHEVTQWARANGCPEWNPELAAELETDSDDESDDESLLE